MYAVFKVQYWLMFYQPSERKIAFSLRSLVKPASISSGFPVLLFLIWRPPALPHRLQCSTIGRLGLNRRVRDGNGCVPQPHRHRKIRTPSEIQQYIKPLLLHSFRKEVIQPHLPIRLPCYDFTPVINPAFGSSFFAVRSLTSGVTDSHGVTGGVYKTRERIHRGILIRDY